MTADHREATSTGQTPLRAPRAGRVTPDALAPDLATALNALGAFLTRFVVFPSPHHARAVTLWIAHTWVIEGFDCTPYLAITSPEKRSGKTRLLDVLELLVRAPWREIGRAHV